MMIKYILAGILAMTILICHGQTKKEDYVAGKIIVSLEKGDITYPSFNYHYIDMPVEIPFIEKYSIKSIKRLFRTESSRLALIFEVEHDCQLCEEDLIKEFISLPYVKYAERMPVVYLMDTPSDPYLPQQWNLNIIKAGQAWDFLFSSQEVVVAVVDDAVMTTHPDLFANIWINSGEIAGNGLDDDLNGYIDDVNGFDVADQDNDPNPPAFNSFSHGTHVAGIVGAVTDNNTGVASIGRYCKIMCVKTKTDNSTGGSLQATLQGIEYAINARADIINMSFGSYVYSQVFQDLINEAYDNGIICVAAAGNDNTNQWAYPASYEHVISVAATSYYDDKAVFSNYGSMVDVSAPGVEIFSTVPVNYDYKSGTSMACPHVSGLLALMKMFSPTSNSDQLVSCLLSSCDPVNYSGSLGAGRINAYEALSCLQQAPVADIFTYNQTICVNSTVQIFDHSSGYPANAWTWNFPGGVPVFSAEQNPYVVYDQPGIYNVYLTVQNQFGSSDTVFTNYLTVQDCNSIYDYKTNWHFGYRSSLDFSSGIPQFVSGSKIFAHETSVTQNDNDGNLLFYCDHNHLYDANNVEITGPGNYLKAYYSASTFVSVPDPANTSVADSRYFLFYIDSLKNLSYTIVRVNNGVVSIDSLRVVLLPSLFTVSEFGVTAGIHCNGRDYWVLCTNDNKIYKHLISPGNIQFMGSYGGLDNYYAGGIKLSPDSRILAVTGGIPQVFLFNNSTGAISSVYLLHSATSQSYMASFSSDSKVIYVGENGWSLGNKTLVGYDLTAANIASSRTIIADQVDFSSMQLGPDHKIYISPRTGNYLWVINKPDSLHNCGFSTNGPYRLTSQVNTLCHFIDAYRPVYSNLTAAINYINCSSITVTASGGQCGTSGTFTWDFGDGTAPQNGMSVSHYYALAGNYTITLCKFNSGICFDTLLIDVQIGYPAASLLGDSVVCAHAMAVYNSSQPGNWTLSGGGAINGSGQNTPNIWVVWNTPGQHVLYYVYDQNGNCDYTDSIVVTVLPSPLLTDTVLSNGTSCCNESVQVIVEGGTPPYLYQWNNGNTSSENDSLCPGLYMLTVSDFNGCNVTMELTIYADSFVSIDAVVLGVSCYGGQDGLVEITANGGTPPYHYFINHQMVADTICCLAPGTYLLNVRDSNGCSGTLSVIIDNPDPIDTVIHTIDAKCQLPNGQATVGVSGGIAGYSWNWSNGAESMTISQVPAGNYSCTVTDDNGCSIVVPVLIGSLPMGTITITEKSNVTCFGESDGNVSVEVVNGSPPYEFNWSHNGATSPTLQFIPAGYYSLYITDDNSCMFDTIIEIAQPDPIKDNALIYNTYQNNQILGNIELNPSGGSPGYVYFWINPQHDILVSSAIYDLTSGYYYVTITDANHCEATYSYVIINNFIIPSVITPNGDGYNDDFEIINIEALDHLFVAIYNRWGDVVFEFEGKGIDYQYKGNRWNGYYKGKILPTGSYLYIVIFNEKESNTGTVLLKQ
jgi:gliding motility-associated-like protein